MKNLIYILLLVGIGSLISKNAYSQETRLAYEDGDISINAGMSFGLIGYGYGYYGSSGFPLPVHANVDIGTNQYLSVGGYIGYLGMSYGTGDNRYKFTSLSFGGHGTFHASTFLNDQFNFDIDDEKIDYYARVFLGFETHSWNIMVKTLVTIITIIVEAGSYSARYSVFAICSHLTLVLMRKVDVDLSVGFL